MNRLVDTSNLLFDKLNNLTIISRIAHMRSIKLAHLIYNWVKDLSSQKISRDGQLAIYQANRRIMRILGIEACEEEHAFYQNISLTNQKQKVETNRRLSRHGSCVYRFR